MRKNSQIAGPRFRGRPALFAVLIALATYVAPLPASAATTNPGELYAFGYNFSGQLGSATNNGNGIPNPAPARSACQGRAVRRPRSPPVTLTAWR